MGRPNVILLLSSYWSCGPGCRSTRPWSRRGRSRAAHASVVFSSVFPPVTLILLRSWGAGGAGLAGESWVTSRGWGGLAAWPLTVICFRHRSWLLEGDFEEVVYHVQGHPSVRRPGGVDRAPWRRRRGCQCSSRRTSRQSSRQQGPQCNWSMSSASVLRKREVAWDRPGVCMQSPESGGECNDQWPNSRRR